MTTTIAGICTPAGASGVGIVRISGAEALAIAGKMFEHPASPLARHPSTAEGNSQCATWCVEPRVVVLGSVFGEGFSDVCLAIFFAAPNSYTGEDTVEFQCHGGWFLLQQVLKTAVKHGAALAERGEFSRRAFMNGRMTLDQAEAVIDIINAESELQLKNAGAVLHGALKNKLDGIEKLLVEVSARIEVMLDYPDETDASTDAVGIQQLIEKCLVKVDELIKTAQTGRLISQGVRVAVLGKPNVGKSSVFNALLQSERSIVTEIAGTTTDVVSESITFGGVKIVFMDTAGLREGKGKIERIGVERTRAAVDQSDVVLAIFDVSAEFDKEDEGILELIKDRPSVVVVNKSDKATGAFALPFLQKREFLMVSAKTGKNIEKIKQAIFDKVVKLPQGAEAIVITNERHLNELRTASEALKHAGEGLHKTTLDLIATDVRAALQALGNITGTIASEAVLDEVFSRFCLGK